MAEFDSLLGRNCPINSSLDFRDRCFAAGIQEWRDVKGFVGMVEYVVGNGTGRVSKDITEYIIKFMVGDSQVVLAPVFPLVSMLVSLEQYRIRSRSCWIIYGEVIKLGLIISHMNRSKIHLASLRSVLLPF